MSDAWARALVITTSALVACGPASVKQATIDTLPGGVIRVVNRGPSGWSDTSGWKIVLESSHTFLADSAGGVERPNYPQTFNDGEMIVVNQVPQYIQRYAADYRPLSRFGRKGSGPGEFQNPKARVFGDSIAVFDQNRSVLSLFTRDGTFLQESIVPNFTDGLGARDGRGLLPLLGVFHSGSDAGIKWWSFKEGRVVDSIIGPAAPPRKMWVKCAYEIPYQASLSLVPTLSGAAWMGLSDRDWFVLTSHGNDTVRVVDNPGRPRFPVDSAEVNELMKPDGWAEKTCGPEMKRADIPTSQPAWGSLIVDGSDNLWVSRPAAYGRSFDVYDPEGRWRGEVPSPIGREENDYWQGDRILTVELLENGDYTLRRYRIDRTVR